MNTPEQCGRPDGTRRQRVYLDEASAAPIAVEVTRGAMVESVHRAIAAVVDAKGRVVRSWGAIDRPVYARSAIKPLQALPVIESGAADTFALGDPEITLCCASHRGELIHTRRITAWLDGLRLDAAALECGPHLPGDEASAHALIRDGIAASAVHNNCSGKHLGMLTTAMHLGEPLRGYCDPRHPVQVRLLRLFEAMAEVDLATADRGIDGCGIPVFALPLRAIAHAMAKFADPSGLAPIRAAACRRIVRACASNPSLIAGTGAANSVILAETGRRCLLKGGAEGVYAAALPDHGLGICLKVDDGAGRAAVAVILALLEGLGVLDKPALARLRQTGLSEVRNWNRVLVGDIRATPAFTCCDT